MKLILSKESDLRATSGRALISIIVLAVLVLAVGIGADRSFAGKKEFTPCTLTIIFSGDDLGNIKPCG